MVYKDYKKFLAEVLINEQQLSQRIAELGKQISEDYAGQDLLLVCVLRGGVMFLTDLMRSLDLPHMIDFMAISSYGVGARQTTGTVRITMDLTMDIYGRNVLVVEDIVDSGRTMASLLEVLSTRQPKSLKICTLLDKAARREVDIQLDYVGFNIEDKFV
ncbi:MAG TPA: hypoxanthine phosphoribosyltransferase, partial [Chloroflexi bacterium]|nr:hypoxanthine phosphoribosyltransferase [Chloroflexota bacterium]